MFLGVLSQFFLLAAGFLICLVWCHHVEEDFVVAKESVQSHFLLPFPACFLGSVATALCFAGKNTEGVSVPFHLSVCNGKNNNPHSLTHC